MVIAVLHPPLGFSDEKKREAEDIRMLIAASGSPLAMRKKAVGAMANGQEPHPDQNSGNNVSIWSPFGELSHSYYQNRNDNILSHSTSSTVPLHVRDTSWAVYIRHLHMYIIIMIIFV